MSDTQITRNLLPAADKIDSEIHHSYYDRSWAVVIGINDYEGRYAGLKNARNDAEAFASLLKEKYGFEVFSLLDKDANGENILRFLREELTNRVGKNDRLIIFFAGHGETQPGKDGRSIGYIIPQDARKSTLIDHIDMDELRKACDRIPAKHILIILDCCFSGVAAITLRLRGESEATPKKLNDAYLRKLTEKNAYQILTAGDVDEPVRDSGYRQGHSDFTAALLDGLEGDADQDHNGLITATELYDYIQQKVCYETSAEGNRGQMPFLDYIRGSDTRGHPGNFVFLLPNLTLDHQDNNDEGSKGPKGNLQTKTAIEKLLPLALILTLGLLIINLLHPIFPPDNIIYSTDIDTHSDPPDVPPDMSPDLKNHYYEIIDLVDRHEFAKALDMQDNITEMYPKYKKFNYFYRGWILNKKGFSESEDGSEEANDTFAKAIISLDRAYALDPNNELSPPNAYILNEKGNAYHYMGPEYYDLAIDEKDAAIKLNKTLDFVWFDKGLLLLKQNRCKEAIEAFDEAIRLNPTNESKSLREKADQCARE